MIQATDILLLLVGGKITTNYLLYWGGKTPWEKVSCLCKTNKKLNTMAVMCLQASDI